MSNHDPAELAMAAHGQRKSLLRLTQLIRESLTLVWHSARRPFVWLVLLQLINAGVMAGQVLVVQQVLAAALTLSDQVSIWSFAVPIMLLAALTAITAITVAVQANLGRFVGESVIAAMWHQVLDLSTSVDLRSFESASFYDQLQRVQSNALTRPYQVTQGLISAAGSLAASIALGVAIVTLQPLLLPLLLIASVPMILTSRRQSSQEFAFTVAQTAPIRERTYAMILQTGREEAKEVRAFGLAPLLKGRFSALYDAYLGELRAHLARRTRLSVIGNLSAAVVLALTFLLMGWFIMRGLLNVASAGAAILAVRMLAGQLQGVIGAIQSIFESGLFLDDLRDFLALKPSATRQPAIVAAPDGGFEQLSAQQVTFTYPGREEPAVADVSIRLAKGELVALVGENGSGKTTLAKLLAGLYTPDEGSIRYNGIDVTELEDGFVSRQTSIMFQDFVHYAYSAWDNIAFGRPEAVATCESIRAAALKAGADGFLESLPDGYRTPLSRIFAGGHELSGGQWQRVAIARTFYRDAPLVILDEPTASLDPRAEHALFESLRGLLDGRTALFISHRFSTVRNADRIVVLANGKVIETGTHPELMDLQGVYAELFTLQAAAYSLD